MAHHYKKNGYLPAHNTLENESKALEITYFLTLENVAGKILPRK
ncbi:hypothetical protein SLEP1_g27639 [Rubroshorea leprosula]|uniref:Uncharacterized protein n=1 Tax=Rubroshorea leprosula TaxID=152421 RepID=A0AAV5JR03_9ROSI|nr:hypothetical protein SLEP1_g27639 [Rubroshorea leprosula]